MVNSDCNRQFLVIPLQNVMNFPLEFFAGTLENEVLVTVPTCQFLIFLHLTLLLLVRRQFEAYDIRHQVIVKAKHSMQNIMIKTLVDYSMSLEIEQ